MVFERVLVAFDGSPASERALARALALRAPDGRLRALTVAETYYATHAGMDAAAWDARIRGDAQSARDMAAAALTEVPECETAVCTGYAAPALLGAAAQLGADLIAVGAHGHSRVAAILLGSVASRIVHDARCSVFVARGSGSVALFPSSIVVGVDRSPASVEASAVAERLAASSGAHIRNLTATGGKRLPDDAAVPAELDRRHPVAALVDASRSADLLIVGSRGAHRFAALGSVAERVAHEAACSVLIVRGSAVVNARRHAKRIASVR
jgi:nucleotide-binding universal stress UspA family protein